MNRRIWKYNPEGDWDCTWQDKYGMRGSLRDRLDMTEGYRDHDTKSLYRSESEIIDVLARWGRVSGNWWSITSADHE
jgi:hypothetical protein